MPGEQDAAAPDPTDVMMALQWLERMGLRPQDLVDAGGRSRAVPTFAEFVPRVSEMSPPPSRRIYGTYWDRLVREWGPRRLDEPSAEEVTGLFERARSVAVVRRSSNGGKGAALHTYYAVSAVFRFAEVEGILSSRENPIRRVKRLAKGQSRRHALSPELYAEIQRAARSTGEDRTLDALLLRFHLETAARTGGALALRVGDLDIEQCLVQLREKGSTQRWQPVSPTLIRSLANHAHLRGAREESSPVLRFKNGSPLTKKRYETLWRRVGGLVSSARTLGVSTHWLRHTTLTWVDRNFGEAVARAYAGHAEPSSNKTGVTHVYVKASLGEVATALQALTWEPHPLALEPLPAVAPADVHPLHVAAEEAAVPEAAVSASNPPGAGGFAGDRRSG